MLRADSAVAGGTPAKNKPRAVGTPVRGYEFCPRQVNVDASQNHRGLFYRAALEDGALPRLGLCVRRYLSNCKSYVMAVTLRWI
jgi:hypothetical protein